MADDLDFSLFGKELLKPSTGERADPEEVLSNKVVREIVLIRGWIEAPKGI